MDAWVDGCKKVNRWVGGREVTVMVGVGDIAGGGRDFAVMVLRNTQHIPGMVQWNNSTNTRGGTLK